MESHRGCYVHYSLLPGPLQSSRHALFTSVITGSASQEPGAARVPSAWLSHPFFFFVIAEKIRG